MVLLVGDMFAPRNGVATVVYLVHREVGHEAIVGGAVPVVLAGLEEDAVAGADFLDRPTLTLATAYALGDEDGLAQWMRVPRGARAGPEVNAYSRVKGVARG